MKTIGNLLRAAREESKLSHKELARLTKIKPEFLESMEREDWASLPELPVLVGFVKSVADVVSLNRDHAAAILRRDYPPTKLNLNPKPDLKRSFRIGPKFAIGALCALIVLALGGYLYFQYKAFVSPPQLSVISPVENELVSADHVTVRGTTDGSATVRINGQPVIVDDDGNFIAEVDVVSQTTEITIKAISRSGKEQVVSRKINVEQ